MERQRFSEEKIVSVLSSEQVHGSYVNGAFVHATAPFSCPFAVSFPD
jgi:hypothetical protein